MKFSFSRLFSYLKCGELYRRAEIEHDYIPPPIVFLRGGSVHKGAEENYKYKILLGHDLPEKNVVEIACEAYTQRLYKEGVYLSKEEKTRKNQALAEGKDSVMRLSQKFIQETAPLVTPLEVEKKFEIPIGPHLFRGRIDTIDKGLTPGDHGLLEIKTVAARKPQAFIDDSDQISMYTLAHKLLYGKWPTRLAMDMLVNTKKAYYYRLITERKQWQIDAFLRRIFATIRGIEKGVFLPTNPQNWWCSERYCGYYPTCPYRSK